MSGLDSRISMLAKVINTTAQEGGLTRPRTLHELRYNLRPLSDAVHTGFGQEVTTASTLTSPIEENTNSATSEHKNQVTDEPKLKYISPWQRVLEASTKAAKNESRAKPTNSNGNQNQEPNGPALEYISPWQPVSEAKKESATNEIRAKSVSPWRRLEKKIMNVVAPARALASAHKRVRPDEEQLLTEGEFTNFRGPNEPGFKDNGTAINLTGKQEEIEEPTKTISTQTDNEGDEEDITGKKPKKKDNLKKKSKKNAIKQSETKILTARPQHQFTPIINRKAEEIQSSTTPKKKVRIELPTKQLDTKRSALRRSRSEVRSQPASGKSMETTKIRSRSSDRLHRKDSIKKPGTNQSDLTPKLKPKRTHSESPEPKRAQNSKEQRGRERSSRNKDVSRKKTSSINETKQSDKNLNLVKGNKKAADDNLESASKQTKEKSSHSNATSRKLRKEGNIEQKSEVKKLPETNEEERNNKEKTNNKRKPDTTTLAREKEKSKTLALASEKEKRENTVKEENKNKISQEPQKDEEIQNTQSSEKKEIKREPQDLDSVRSTSNVIMKISSDSEDDTDDEMEKSPDNLIQEVIPNTEGTKTIIEKEIATGAVELDYVRAKTEREKEEGNLEAGIPPGNDEITALEELLAQTMGDDDDELVTGLDPAMVKQVEEQIFKKIRFYKEVIDKVREKPWPLKKKITLLKEARDYTAKFEGKLSTGGGPGQTQRFKVALAKFNRALANYTAVLIPWEGKIRSIESYFGSVVASYFTFLRWVFWINIVQAVIVGVVIIMPEVMWGPDWGSVAYKSIPANETNSAADLKTLWDFEGYAKASPLFYGYYSNIKRYESGYRMPLGYLFGNLMTFAYSFATILRQIAANSKDEKAADKDENFTFSWKTFVSWDYMIGNAETAKNKVKAIVIAVRESITECKEKKKKIGSKLKFLRFLANVAVLCVLASSTYAIYLTVERSKEFEQRAKLEGPGSVSWWETNEISVVMSLATTLFPILFDIIALLEDYHPRIALQWSLGRIMVLYLLNLYTLYIALYWKIQDIQTEAKEQNSTFYASLNMSNIISCTTLTPLSNVIQNATVNQSTTAPNVMTMEPFLYNLTSPDELPCGIPEYIPDVTCWETMVGQELFKLTVFDFVTTIAVIYASEFFRALYIRIFNSCWCWDMEKYFPAYAEFSLAENLLHLIYNQGMIWMGTLFSPGLPIFNLFKLLCLFYVRAWSVMVCNVPHERIFKAGSDNFYLAMLLFMLYVVMIPIAFAMVTIQPSRNCGPYKDIDFMYLSLTKWMEEVFSSSVNSVFEYISSPGALIPIFVLVFLLLYYLNSSNDALHGTVMDLKKQLQYERTEGKKKVFNMAGAPDVNKKDDHSSVRDDTSSVAITKPSLSPWTAVKAVKKLGGFKNATTKNNLSTASPMLARSASKTSLASEDSGTSMPTMFSTVTKARSKQPKSTNHDVEAGSLPPSNTKSSFNMNSLATATQFLVKLRKKRQMNQSLDGMNTAV